MGLSDREYMYGEGRSRKTFRAPWHAHLLFWFWRFAQRFRLKRK